MAFVPARERDVSRSSRTLGWGCDGRGSVVTRFARGRTAMLRTAKSCGPDAPTLASSSREAKLLWGDGGKQARSPGRARRKPLKPLRRGCRVIPAVTVVTTLVWFLFLPHARLRVRRAPGIPCALVFEAKDSCTTRTQSRRENADVCPGVIASEAKQSTTAS